MNIDEYLHNELAEHSVVLKQTGESIPLVFAQLVRICRDSLRNGHKLLFFGNGGSAADAQHLATEFVVRYRTKRPAMRALALTTDTSVLTAIGNDLGFDDLFARQVEAVCRPGDVAIGISTSGNSQNVIRGLKAAKAIGAVTVGLGGGNGGCMVENVDCAVIIPSTTTARIQEMHLLLGHTLCALLEEELLDGAQED